MDQRYSAIQTDSVHVQMDMQRLHIVQQSHADRIARLEKRQADDAALKSVWGNPPFPNIIGGTPHNGPFRKPSHEQLDDFDEQGQNLIGSLQLEADDEPVRRGVNASRANSVRFDESALQGANWGQSSRHSGDFGPTRPGSAFGGHSLMERSFSHKSDGRHSSAGHSVHSIHSAPSGRASSLGLDTNFAVGSGDEEFTVNIPDPPPGLFVLGTCPAIMRCWLTENFGHDTLLYFAACTGSHKSTISHSLVRELDLSTEIRRDMDGVRRISIPVFLTEAIVIQSSHRGSDTSSQQPIPSITTTFEVINYDQPEAMYSKQAIRLVIGSDTLRAHSADILFSRNTMTILGDQREKLTVPFVRPEDEGAFKHLTTSNMISGKPQLNANAAPFVSSSSVKGMSSKTGSPSPEVAAKEPLSPATSQVSRPDTGVSNPSENSEGYERQSGNGICNTNHSQSTITAPDTPGMTPTENGRQDSTASGIWGPWRQHSVSGGESSQRDSDSPGSQRSTRGMKVLKSSKLMESARTGASYELPPARRTSVEARRKSTGPLSESLPPTPAMRWDSKDQKRGSLRGGDSSTSSKGVISAPFREPRSSLTRSANPVGGASAFKWMSSSGAGSKTPTAVAE